MNYAVVAIGSLLVLIVISWVTWGHKQYTGSRPALVIEVLGTDGDDAVSEKYKDRTM